jgi:hypothetical protein
MKTKLFILSFLALAVGRLSAHVITVSNGPVSGGHFYNLQIAIDSANVGDTVYCIGSPNNYNSYGESTYNDNNIHITNRITLIGAGYAVTGTQNNYVSYISGSIILDSNAFTVQLSGTKILGMDCGSQLYQNGSGSINNVDVERCYIPSWVYVFGHGWTIINNDIYGVIVQYNAYTYIQNNFLYQVQNSNQTTVVISNNDFVISGGNPFYTVSNALIANNVFFYDNPDANVTSCVFTNNIAFNGSALVLPPAGNTGSGNSVPASLGVFGFTDASLTGYVGQNVWTHVWTFKPSSPAYHGGTDGTDMGVNGGAYPYPNYTGATRIPQMTLLNVPAIVPQGGSMNVNFKARDQK